MVAVHLRRGPWGVIQATWPEASAAYEITAGGPLDEVATAILAHM